MYIPKRIHLKNIVSYIDQIYEFKNGKAIIIVGENEDNPNQKRNGSGKSGFVESIAFAFVGTSIRDVKVKELINDASESGEVEFILYNTQTKKDLKIWRKIFAGNKSAQCKIWLGDEEIKCSDINNYNKWIFEHIGISKEDFFTFYLLSLANYQPFLRIGDVGKKEIVNRFSGAERIDNLISFVKEDYQSYEPKLQSLQNVLSSLKAKIEIYQEQIEEFERKKVNQKEDLENFINEKKSLIEIEDNQINKIKEISNFDKKLEMVNKELGNLNKDYHQNENLKIYNEKVQEKKKLQEKNNDLKLKLKNIKYDFSDLIDNIKKDEKEYEEEFLKQVEYIKQLEQVQSDLEKQLQHMVSCPNCKHVFSFSNKEISIDYLEKELPFVNKELEESIKKRDQFRRKIDVKIVQEKKKVNNLVLEKQQEINKEIEKNSLIIIDLDKKMQDLNNKNLELENLATTFQKQINQFYQEKLKYENQIEVHLSNIKKIENQIEEEKSKDYNNQINDLIEKQKEVEKSLKNQESEIEKLEKDMESVLEWEINFKNFKSYVANQSISNIQDYTNLFLQQMGSDISIKLDGFSVLSTGKIKEQISVEVKRGGFSEGSYGKYSGGERGRIDICVILAIQQLINLNCNNGGLDLLICDEILDQVDQSGLESIINSLQNLDRTIMIVSQNEINALKDYTLTVRKKNRISNFIN